MNKSAALRTKSKIKTKHTELIRSPVFYELSHHLANEKKIRILDLGKAQPGSVSFFNQYDCLYHILDIYPILSECKQAKKEPDQEFKKRISRLFGDLLAFDEQVQFDLVLFWDGLNYLDRKVLTLFMEYLLKHSHRHTFYHCYIYGHQNIPLHWGGFDILSDLYHANSPD